jgi:hypothetical protein
LLYCRNQKLRKRLFGPNVFDVIMLIRCFDTYDENTKLTTYQNINSFVTNCKDGRGCVCLSVTQSSYFSVVFARFFSKSPEIKRILDTHTQINV